MTTLVLLHTGVGVRRVVLDSRSAKLAGGLPSGPILSGLSRTILVKGIVK